VFYREVAPPPPLDAFVKCLWILEAPAAPGGAAPDTIVPDGCAEVVFHFGDRFRRVEAGVPVSQFRTAVVGPSARPLQVLATGRVGVLGVRLRPEGIAALLGVPADEVAGRSLPIDAVLGAEGRRIEERVCGARDSGERLAAAAAAFGRRAREATLPERVGAAVALVRRTLGRATVDDMAEAAGVTGRHLERLFREEVGLPPKTLSRLVRFRAALALLRRGHPLGTVGVAADLGYSDQAHLHRDFREFAGAPPGAFLRRAGGVGEPFNS